jgi:hypothetical protein
MGRALTRLLLLFLPFPKRKWLGERSRRKLRRYLLAILIVEEKL